MHKNTIKITNLHLTPTIGVYDKERKNSQDIFVDITINHTRSRIEDTLDTTLDYDHIVEDIEKYAASHTPYLIETLGEAIADICLVETSVTDVQVEVRKPSVLKNGMVSIVITKEK